jgi:hypothetical protein
MMLLWLASEGAHTVAAFRHLATAGPGVVGVVDDQVGCPTSTS